VVEERRLDGVEEEGVDSGDEAFCNINLVVICRSVEQVGCLCTPVALRTKQMSEGR
jgi:hypothetical protein